METGTKVREKGVTSNKGPLTIRPPQYMSVKHSIKGRVMILFPIKRNSQRTSQKCFHHE